MNFLVTAGATREPIDAVRFLSNLSTGATGATLAEALVARGHTVSLLRGEGSVPPRCAEIASELFGSADHLRRLVERRLASGEFDTVVMAAAVSDYRVARVFSGKIPSDQDGLTLELVRNAKLLPLLKSFSPRPLRVIGFKLTVGADRAARSAAVNAQFAAGGVDLVVQNDLEEIRATDRGAHPFWIYRAASAEPWKVLGTLGLAAALEPSGFKAPGAAT